MASYHIGLDFGTNQTKACILKIGTNEVREFFKFENSNYFLPSRVGIKKNGKVVYGEFDSSDLQADLAYFKIASAEDEEFLVQTDPLGVDKSVSYSGFDYHGYTPEFLSVIFITNILYLIKAFYNERTPGIEKKSSFKLGSLLGNGKKKKIKHSFSVKLGIPTEWSQKTNMRRKRKFESILLIAEELQRHYTKEEFAEKNVEELKYKVALIYGEIIENVHDKEEFDQLLNQYRISVFPETAAGLNFIIASGQLKPGPYTALDIGAGSTDISYFLLISTNGPIKYIASESYLLGANTIYRKYKDENNSTYSLKLIERDVRHQVSENILDEELDVVFRRTNEMFERTARKLFARGVRFFGHNSTKLFNNTRVLLYGGGAQFPIIRSGELIVWNNGNPLAFTNNTVVHKEPIQNFIDNIPNVRNIDEAKKHIPLLAVALGLSYITHGGAADWFGDKAYVNQDQKDGKPVFVPHPYNEDCYIYDVLKRKFYDPY
jgi:hypothetical protein